VNDAEEGEEGARKCAECGKTRLTVDEEYEHTSPEESREDEAVTEHGQALVHDLKTERELVHGHGHGAHKLSENDDHEIGDDRQEAETHRRRMRLRHFLVCLTDDLKPDENEYRRQHRTGDDADN